MTLVHLLCDRCRAEGQLGEDPFAAYAGLLEFTPVPRRTTRADGWDQQCQRAFIAALAATGSARQAAAAVGKAQFGVENLKKAPGNESFMAAFERALAFYAENRSLRLADGVRAASALAAHRHAAAPRPAWINAATRRGAIAPLPGPAEKPDPPEPAPPVTAEARERLHAESFRRAMEGEDVPVFHGGVQVGTKRVFNDRLILHHLKEAEAGAGTGAPAGARKAWITDPREIRLYTLLKENR